MTLDNAVSMGCRTCSNQPPPSGSTPRKPVLGAREREVLLTWLLQDTKEHTARTLYITPNTVRTHVERVRAKYAAIGRPAATKTELLIRAIQDGLLPMDEIQRFGNE